MKIQSPRWFHHHCHKMWFSSLRGNSVIMNGCPTKLSPISKRSYVIIHPFIYIFCVYLHDGPTVVSQLCHVGKTKSFDHVNLDWTHRQHLNSWQSLKFAEVWQVNVWPCHQLIRLSDQPLRSDLYYLLVQWKVQFNRPATFRRRFCSGHLFVCDRHNMNTDVGGFSDFNGTFSHLEKHVQMLVMVTVRSWWRSSRWWCARTSSTARRPPASPSAPSQSGRPSRGRPAAHSPPRSAAGTCIARPSRGCTQPLRRYEPLQRSGPLKTENRTLPPPVTPPPSSGHTDVVTGAEPGLEE